VVSSPLTLTLSPKGRGKIALDNTTKAEGRRAMVFSGSVDMVPFFDTVPARGVLEILIGIL